LASWQPPLRKALAPLAPSTRHRLQIPSNPATAAGKMTGCKFSPPI
jgi:hypothetical protein